MRPALVVQRVQPGRGLVMVQPGFCLTLWQEREQGWALQAQVRPPLSELPRVFRTGNYRLIYAAEFIPSSSSMTSRGVLYPSVE